MRAGLQIRGSWPAIAVEGKSDRVTRNEPAEVGLDLDDRRTLHRRVAAVADDCPSARPRSGPVSYRQVVSAPRCPADPGESALEIANFGRAEHEPAPCLCGRQQSPVDGRYSVAFSRAVGNEMGREARAVSAARDRMDDANGG